jgi:UDP-N-acetyl-D-glucosamine dehydrogenase
MSHTAIADSLITAFQDRSATIGIIGLGYVGLPLALRYAEAGYAVIGFDIDPAKIEMLGQGRSYFAHIPPERVAAVNAERFRPPPISAAPPRRTP